MAIPVSWRDAPEVPSKGDFGAGQNHKRGETPRDFSLREIEVEKPMR